jgi:hypothetical protein
VWVFTATQGGKSSEKKALATINAEGRRVLGVLNKRDTLSAADEAELVTYVQAQLEGLVEIVVPFSARRALAHKRSEPTPDDGNWGALISALEERFFQQARALKRAACARRVSTVIADARQILADAAKVAHDAAARLSTCADDVESRQLRFIEEVVTRERRELTDAETSLLRRAAREVLDLVRPRRLPFGSHTATPADRDYLLALLDDGFAAALDASRARVLADLRRDADAAVTAAGAAASVLGADLRGDLARVGDDRIEIVGAEVYARARAYLRGYLEGGYVESFFKNDLPRLELAEDSTYHALVRAAPDLEREVATPLARAGAAALDALATRLRHWAAVADAHTYDLDVGIGRALDSAHSRLS